MTTDTRYGPGKRKFWSDMNHHASARYFQYPGYDYIVEVQHGYVKVWQAVSDRPDTEDNEFEWEKVAETEFETQDEAEAEGERITSSIRTLRSFIDSHDVCPVCGHEHFDKEEFDADYADEAWERANSGRKPCIDSPMGETTVTAYYHTEEDDG